MEEERKELIIELKESIAKIKTLKGFIPICSHCKKLRDADGRWVEIGKYFPARPGPQPNGATAPVSSKKFAKPCIRRCALHKAL